MAVLSGNRIAWTYTSDLGIDYRVAAMKAYTDQSVLGGLAADPTLAQKPSSLKMRRCTVSDATGRSRVVPAYSNTAPIGAAGTSINVNYLGDSHALTSNGGFIPEGGPRRNVTKQST